jgi:hypothetical protein
MASRLRYSPDQARQTMAAMPPPKTMNTAGMAPIPTIMRSLFGGATVDLNAGFLQAIAYQDIRYSIQ